MARNKKSLEPGVEAPEGESSPNRDLKTPVDEAVSANDSSEKKAILRRAARVAGHWRAIVRMIEEERAVDAIVPQLAAVRSAIDGIERALVQAALERKISAAERGEGENVFKELREIVAKYLK